ncbi:MAG: transglutaminase domain-containing protein [Chitinophagaceae bacterium]
MKRSFFFCILFFLTAATTSAQDKLKIKFGSVTADDFKTTVYPIDSNATAIIVADIGSTEIIGNTKGSFSLLFNNYRRAHILNKNGYNIGDVQISLYTNGESEEELENLKAVTYNLENGKVVQTKLEIKSAVFKDKVSKNLVVKKFTFPNIKAGSIIEYEYKIKSDFIFNLQPWDFQGEFPRLWSEYNFAMPSFYNYVTLSQGYHPFAIKTSSTSRSSFNMADIRGSGATERVDFNANVVDYRWVMKDVPSLKEESFTSTLRNHISRIEFQLASIGEPFTPRQVMSSWKMAAKDLLEDEDFGEQLSKDNGWLNEVMPLALRGATNVLAKAKNIYEWVRDNFTCTNYNRKYLEQPLKNVLKNRNGNVAEINLLMTAMLRKANIQADPVILSTRSHGYTHSAYPLMDRYNYVICRTEAESKEFFLDACEPGMGFGKLDYKCYNGSSRIINSMAEEIYLNASSLKEVTNTIVFVINDEQGNSIGSFQQTPGYLESSRFRKLAKEKGKEQVFSEFQKAAGEDIKVSNTKIDSLFNYDEPVKVSFDIDFINNKEDIIYFNPMLGEGFKENPFKSAERFYPVEMPYTMDETYNLQMEVPTGYVVDELPKGAVVKFNEAEDAIFEYRLSLSGGNISFRSRLVIKKAYFLPEEYEVLREFFALIVK